MTPTATADAVELACEIFGNNLLLAFVGGSHARGSARASSDIDLFVLLKEGDLAREISFALAFRKLHDSQGMDFHHCGEVFDAESLASLLTFTEAALEAMPLLQAVACYQADCVLSVFRKGDVIFKFLHDPKINVRDQGDVLPSLEGRAEVYFRRWPLPRVQHHKGNLELPSRGPEERLRSAWTDRERSPHWMHSPTGVGLDRWFGSQLAEVRIQGVEVPSDYEVNPRVCPLVGMSMQLSGAISKQCLAHIREPKGGEQS